jgi:hypothetical protein
MIEITAFVFSQSMNRIPTGTVVFRTTSGETIGNARLDSEGMARLKITEEKFHSKNIEVKAYYAGNKHFAACVSEAIVKKIM